jgi:hypothetical protein
MNTAAINTENADRKDRFMKRFLNEFRIYEFRIYSEVEQVSAMTYGKFAIC